MPVDITKPLDDRTINAAEEAFMRNLQANILKGHGREHVALVFLEVEQVAAARTYLHAYPVSDAFTQHQETQAFKRNGTPGGPVRLVFLSQPGLRKFNQHAKFTRFGAFNAGMASDTGVLDDGTTASWQPELKQQADVLLLLAHHDEAEFGRLVGGVVHELGRQSSPFEVLFVQEGRAYRNGDGEGVEHFGYVDGRSQPLMLRTQIDAEPRDIYDPTAPLNQFIIPDPLQAPGHGSFFVFRKLEQNVAGFKAAEEALGGTTLGLQGADEERAGAQVVGRFEDGTPLTIASQAEGAPVRNDFDYSGDSGGRCPFQGHIRKTNPRGGALGSKEFDKSKQMARRGITYGCRLQHPDTKELIDKPSDGVGLLFMSYQASIEDQFQFMQVTWANNEGFPGGGVGIDPIIGQRGSAPQTWPPTYGSTANGKTSRFAGFVKLRGGDYFYTPSPLGLKNL